MLRCALEALAQHRVLGGDANRAGVEMALAHHDAASGDQRRGGEAEFVGAEQGADDHVTAGLQTTVDLQRNARTQAVQHQRLVGLGEADFPGAAGMLERGQRRGAGAAVIAGDGDMVGARLGNAGRDRADAHFRHQLDRDVGRPG